MTGTVEDLLIATYKPLFEAERVRRDQIRASLAVPMTALSVAMVGFGVLLNNFEWHGETSIGLWLSVGTVVAALIAVVCLGRALTQLLKADQPEIREDPATLRESQTFIEERTKELLSQGQPDPPDIVLMEMKASLAEDYADCYAYMVEVNVGLLLLRDAALRWLARALLILVVAFVGTGLDNNQTALKPLFDLIAPSGASSTAARPAAR